MPSQALESRLQLPSVVFNVSIFCKLQWFMDWRQDEHGNESFILTDQKSLTRIPSFSSETWESQENVFFILNWFWHEHSQTEIQTYAFRFQWFARTRQDIQEDLHMNSWNCHHDFNFFNNSNLKLHQVKSQLRLTRLWRKFSRRGFANLVINVE